MTMPKLAFYSLAIATASYFMCTGSWFWGIILFCGSTAFASPTRNLKTPLNKQHLNNLIRSVGISLTIALLAIIATYAGLNKDIAWKFLFVSLGAFAIGNAWWQYIRSART